MIHAIKQIGNRLSSLLDEFPGRAVEQSNTVVRSGGRARHFGVERRQLRGGDRFIGVRCIVRIAKSNLTFVTTCGLETSPVCAVRFAVVAFAARSVTRFVTSLSGWSVRGGGKVDGFPVMFVHATEAIAPSEAINVEMRLFFVTPPCTTTVRSPEFTTEAVGSPDIGFCVVM